MDDIDTPTGIPSTLAIRCGRWTGTGFRHFVAVPPDQGVFPDSLLAASDAASLRWREDFVRSYLQRDVPMFAPRLPAETVGRLRTMLAHPQGALLQQSRLASGLGVSSPAVERYIDLLVDLQLVCATARRPWGWWN